MEITRELAKRVLETVDAGLVCGLGHPEPGQMCVEAAVRYAMGMPHGDDPPCVNSLVRAFKISLNDLGWGTPQARAHGLRRVAIAQLGSLDLDGDAFVFDVILGVYRQIVPMGLRALKEEYTGDERNLALIDELIAKFELAAEVNLRELANRLEETLANLPTNVDSYWHVVDAHRRMNPLTQALRIGNTVGALSWAVGVISDMQDAVRDAGPLSLMESGNLVLEAAAGIAEESLVRLGSQGAAFLDLAD